MLLGLWVAAKPADADHPYGHGRFEILTGLGIGVLLAITGTGISLRSIEQRHAAHFVAAFAVWPLMGSIVLKSIFALVKRNAARTSGSAGMQADSWHDVIDMLSSMVALIGVTLTLISPAWAAADHVIAGTYRRDRESAGPVMGSAIAFRLFLFFVPLLLLIVGIAGFASGLVNARAVSRTAGIYGSLGVQISEAFHQPGFTRWFAVLFGLFGC